MMAYKIMNDTFCWWHVVPNIMNNESHSGNGHGVVQAHILNKAVLMNDFAHVMERTVNKISEDLGHYLVH